MRPSTVPYSSQHGGVFSCSVCDGKLHQQSHIADKSGVNAGSTSTSGAWVAAENVDESKFSARLN